MGESGADCSAMLRRGLEFITEGAARDAEGNYREALRLYSLGLESLISVLKYERNERIVSTLKGKVSAYMARAEQLKSLITEGSGLQSTLPSPPLSHPSAGASSSSPTTRLPEAPLSLPSVPGAGPRSFSRSPAAPAASGPANAQLVRISIAQGQTGCGYSTLFGQYLAGAQEVHVRDPYVRSPHQCYNFLRLVELLIKLGSCRQVVLTTSLPESEKEREDMGLMLGEITTTARDHNLAVRIEYSNTLHDRDIRASNGWVIRLGRGLDFYQRPRSKFAVGFCDFDLRPCLETSIDIHRETPSAAPP